MYLTHLRLTDFRNHADSELFPDPGINLILGPNAQGKTNLLEAIVCLSRAHSFRTRKETELIRFDQPGACLEGTLSGGERDFELRLVFGEHRTACINGVRQKRSADFASLFHTVVFCPEDLDIVRGSSTGRRKLIDTALCALRPAYAQLFAEYGRLHAHITRLLQEGDPDGLLDDFAYRLVSVGARLIPYRAAFCEALSAQAAAFHAQIAEGESLAIRYKTVSAVDDPNAPAQTVAAQLWEHYRTHKEGSLRSGSLLTGPHRDDLIFTVNDVPAREYASQGQARTAAISCKLAEREIFRKSDGCAPILLLDDVLSELDSRRRAFILQGIRDGQVFITACDAQKDEISAQKVYTVLNGQVTEG